MGQKIGKIVIFRQKTVNFHDLGEFLAKIDQTRSNSAKLKSCQALIHPLQIDP